MRLWKAHSVDHRMIDVTDDGSALSVFARSRESLYARIREETANAIGALKDDDDDDDEPVVWRVKRFELVTLCKSELLIRCLEGRGYVRKQLDAFDVEVRGKRIYKRKAENHA